MIRLTEEMFMTGKPVAQGEVLIWMKKYAPKEILENLSGNYEEMKLENDRLIIGHSETGHHHVLEPEDKTIPKSKAATVLIDKLKDMWMELKLQEPCELLHLRGYDTHTGFTLPAGEYIRGIREEQTPEGWRRVAD